MDLATEVKRKNEALLMQGILLQHRLSTVSARPEFTSYLITFILAPFVVGTVAPVALGAKKSSLALTLYRAVFPVLRLRQLFVG